jgi:hypothetical protein
MGANPMVCIATNLDAARIPRPMTCIAPPTTACTTTANLRYIIFAVSACCMVIVKVDFPSQLALNPELEGLKHCIHISLMAEFGKSCRGDNFGLLRFAYVLDF